MANQVARVGSAEEEETLSWIEAVSEFDAPERRGDDETR